MGEGQTGETRIPPQGENDQEEAPKIVQEHDDGSAGESQADLALAQEEACSRRQREGEAKGATKDEKSLNNETR